MRIKSPLLIKAAGRLGYLVMSCIFLTVKRDLYHASVNPYDAIGEQRYLFALWHDSAVMATFLGKQRRTVALTSQHRDGSFVESILAPVGVKTVRGSTSRGGRRAARALIEAAKENNVVLVPDGPRGPRREMSRGIVYLASRTENPIVPVAFACDRYWEIKSSWTSHTVPKPFSTIVMAAGDPIQIPSTISPDGLEEYRASVQRAMDHAQETADQNAARLREKHGASQELPQEQWRSAA